MRVYKVSYVSCSQSVFSVLWYILGKKKCSYKRVGSGRESSKCK